MRYPSCLVGCAEFLSRCAGKRDNRGGYTQCSDGEVPFPLQYLLFTPVSDNGVRRSGWQLKNGWYRLLFHLRRTYEYVWVSKCPKWCVVIQGNPYSSLLQEKLKVEECGMRKVVSLRPSASHIKIISTDKQAARSDSRSERSDISVGYTKEYCCCCLC